MSDHLDSGTDVEAERALDALLAAHQTELLTTVASALDTETGLQHAHQTMVRYGPKARSDKALMEHTSPDTPAIYVLGNKTTYYLGPKPRSAALLSALESIELEITHLQDFDIELTDNPWYRTGAPSGGQSPAEALVFACERLGRIRSSLRDGEPTKGEVEALFEPVESALGEQVMAWAAAEEVDAPGPAHLDRVLTGFMQRHRAAVGLRVAVVRLFEGADEIAVLFN
ncbi:hypothetical protein ACFWCB_15890 [Streptomyces sp. NPDC060048]|uniref:hypothetical protein n=1 Tax=unclassified Streptomyces TaxID=2593676 RepID=UPI0036C27B6D